MIFVITDYLSTVCAMQVTDPHLTVVKFLVPYSKYSHHFAFLSSHSIVKILLVLSQ